MSRGLGKFQRAVITVILGYGRPVTFAQIMNTARTEPASSFRPSFIRSVRRAIHKLVRDGTLMAIGGGGRSDPFRYFPNPVALAIMSDEPNYDARLKALTADPGAAAAMHKAMQGMFRDDAAATESPVPLSCT